MSQPAFEYATTITVTEASWDVPDTVRPATTGSRRRCGACGRFLSRAGRCAQEVPVSGGWMWEHR